ncbi:MAG: NAD/NADP octopine/nopaline dehydrogenase family protein [Nitrospinota bacterium]
MPEVRKVAVLGAGHGGCAAAAVLTLRGYEVRMHSRSEGRLAPLRSGISVRGEYQGRPIPALLTTDLASAVSGADLVMLVVPSVAHEGYARALAPVLRPEQVVYLNPGHTGGGFHFAAELRAAGGSDAPLCESVTLTYICRMEGEATVAVYRETTNLRFAALPAGRTEELTQRLRPLFPNLRPASNVLETGFMNINAVIHPPGVLMNAGWIEFTGGDVLFYKESITPAVARVIEEVDAERLAVAGRLGLRLPAFIDYFCEAGLTTEAARRSRSVYRAMQESGPNRTIKSPSSLDHRYVHEDVGYGLMPMSEFGRLVGVSTPAMDSLITLASIAQNKDYRREGLTLARMGVEGLSPEELLASVA